MPDADVFLAPVAPWRGTAVVLVRLEGNRTGLGWWPRRANDADLDATVGAVAGLLEVGAHDRLQWRVETAGKRLIV
jgi:hypothetical protein